MTMFPRDLYTDEQLLFAQSVRDIVKKEIEPNHHRWEKEQMVSRESWLRLGEAGLLCMQVDEQYGGLGLTDFRYQAIVIEELGRPGFASEAIGYPLHTGIVCPYLEHYGTESLKHRWLPKMVTGEAISCVAMSEPGAGTDLQNMRTTAVDKGDYYLINGSKTFITNGYLSDIAVVAAKTDPTQGAKGISLFVIEVGMKGFTKGKPFEKAGLHAQDTCELFFENVEVPKDNLLGKAGEGFKYLMTELMQERLIVGLGGIAAAEGVLAETIKYTKERIAFGKSISEFQNTRFKLAEMATEIGIGRVFADKCVLLHNDGKLDAAMASAIKYWLTDLQYSVADEGVQLHGGYGYIWEYMVARAWADARAQRIYAGTNEIMKEVIARGILK
jgi:alkylation response protein AidB-like acyl-CoA dehydrogenase